MVYVKRVIIVIRANDARRRIEVIKDASFIVIREIRQK